MVCPSIEALSNGSKDSLKLRLAAVCKASCDPLHLYGSTYTPPTVFTTYGDSSFVQIIEDYIGNDQDLCSDCHANVISFPGTYFVPAYISARTVESRLNTCACENFEVLRGCYTDNPMGYSSFQEYLTRYSEVPFTSSDSLILAAACSTSARFLPSPLTLPPYLECSVCKTCAEVNTLVLAFPGSCTSADPGYYTQLARFLNEKLGFNRSAEDYRIFLDSCASAAPSDCRILMLCPEELNPTIDASSNCVEILLAQADVQAEIAYDELLRAARADFVSQYLSRCLNNLSGESFYVNSPLLEYQYTLYYYDQSNLLTQTIPPAGVTPLDLDALGGNGQSHRSNIRANRANPGSGTATYPTHTLPTRYAYNALGGVVKQIAPDHLENLYFYDEVGRLVASQDGRQRPGNKYSYTLYDALGRVTQTGEGTNSSAPATILTEAAFNTWFSGVSSKAQVTRTYYDATPSAIEANLPNNFLHENQRSRVAASTIIATYNASDDVYDYATHYSYDITGDVATILQDLPELAADGHGYKRIDYDYDQLSGKVNAVFYQKGEADQFSYRYFYDQDNRLTQAMSSFTDTLPLGALWDREASYKYFQHGPLSRTELGHYRVQGMDYTYTLQGWIKGLNASFLNPFRDMGQDAYNNASSLNRYVAADAFAYTLGFYNDVNSLGSTKIKDYYPIGGGSGQMEVSYVDTGSDTAPFHTDAKSQFTGNIRFIAKQTRDMTPNGASIQTYRYDQLMRLNAMNTYFPGASALSSWLVRATGFTAPLQSIYKEADITYDRNGNILTYQRWGNNASVQDSLNYKYIAGTNKLSRVADQVSAGTYAGDVDGQSAGNYTYDGAGNLSTDAQGGASITWSPYGKVLEVYRAALTSTTLFGYDATQNRVKKQQTSLSSNISTFYIRDAQGNVLAVYEKDGSTITWKEQHLYGSSRLGSIEPGVAWTAAPDTVPYFRSSRALKYGWKRYEITDHLGNVRALVSDRKTYNVVTFIPAILNATDYFPFGSEMRGSVTAGNQKHRYGFNGKELDKNGEFGGLNHYDYGFRIYNPGIGRFLSVDPLTSKYPELTPYQFAGNSPIKYIDLDGLEIMPKPNEGNQSVFSVHIPDPLVPRTQEVVQIWHSGSPQMKAGWYSDDEYYKHITKAAQEHGRIDGTTANVKMPTSTFQQAFNIHKYFQPNELNETWIQKYGDDYQEAYEEGYAQGLNGGQGNLIPNYIEFDIISIFAGIKIGKDLARKAFQETTESLANNQATGLTNTQLVEKAAKIAEKALGGTGPVAGTSKHTYARRLLERYQEMFGSRGLNFSEHFNNGVQDRGFLDVVDHANRVIYDFKFGKAVMSNAQRTKYLRNFPGYTIQIVRP